MSSPTTTITFEVTVSPDGEARWHLIDSHDATVADQFLCEQAMWERGPTLPSGIDNFTGVKTAVRFEGARNEDNQFADHEWFRRGLMPGVITMHVMPTFISALCRDVVIADFDSPANLVRIQVDQLNSPDIVRFREDWEAFVKRVPKRSLSQQELWRQSKVMREKYSNLFACRLPTAGLSNEEIYILNEGRYECPNQMNTVYPGTPSDTAQSFEHLRQMKLITIARYPSDGHFDPLTESEIAELFKKMKTREFWGPENDTERAHLTVHDTPAGLQLWRTDQGVWDYIARIKLE